MIWREQERLAKELIVSERKIIISEYGTLLQ